MAVARRAIGGVLVPKIRNRLAMQPLPMRLAEEVDRAVARKVSAALGFSYRNTTALTLPPDNLGFGFPSFFRMNGELAVAMVLRLLNHPLSAVRNVFKVRTANWSCLENDCLSPLDDATDTEMLYLKEARDTPNGRFTVDSSMNLLSPVVPTA